MRNNRGFTLIDTMITLAVIGVLASVVVPRMKVASASAVETNITTQLFTLRHQIELYNANASTAFDPTDLPDGAQWKPLLQNNYLQAAPKNPLQAGATYVATSPGPGVGWVWSDALGNGVTTIFAVDNQGNYFDVDGDGVPD